MTIATRMVKAIIPAAGLGTRFLPATKASPKEMLPLVDKPLIQYAVEEAVSAGVTDIILITGRGKRAIADHFDVSFELEEVLRKDGKRVWLRAVRKIAELANFCYIRQREPKGLGDAVLCARHLIGDEPFAVLLGDEVLDAPVSALLQLRRAYERVKSPVIGIQEVAREDVSKYGVIQGRAVGKGLFLIKDVVEKPSPREAPSRLASLGRYILTPDIFEQLARTQPDRRGEIQLTDAIRRLARRRSVYALMIKGERYDAGDKLGFLKATVAFALKNPELGGAFRRYLKQLAP